MQRVHACSSMAIFHEPSGGTIAFPYFLNLRYYAALHFDKNRSECYSYWYVTMAHELAHHLVSAHGKEHGFYTESYAAHYLPQLVPCWELGRQPEKDRWSLLRR